jgi:predicted Rossmann fold nucleotide-binding protein DprA/Smf involved in DNA uptake
MNPSLSDNTQAILLLTAPLIVSRGQPPADLLSPGEYKRLARHLHQLGKVPADLLSGQAEDVLREVHQTIGSERLKSLLWRGLALSQAIDRWQTRSIWVVSRADAEYPQLLKDRLKDDRPAVIYGCGERLILEGGGLAVVGSRDVDEALIDYTESVGRLVSKAGKTLVSGGARGIDQAAMRGALQAGGRVIGVMADSLEKAAMNREHREMLMEGQLVLISPYDPGAGFNVGNAMQRNKLIYALSDAALVVNSDLGKGGTWAGAVEQLDKLRLVPVYVRSSGAENKAFVALQQKGALPWPNPTDSEGLVAALSTESVSNDSKPVSSQLGIEMADVAMPMPIKSVAKTDLAITGDTPSDVAIASSDSLLVSTGSVRLPEVPVRSEVISIDPAEMLFEAAKHSISLVLVMPKKDAVIAEALKVNKAQMKDWLLRLIDDGYIEKAKGSLYQLRKADLIDLCSSNDAVNDSDKKK